MPVQWRIEDLAKGGHGKRAEREPISGVQRQSPWLGGQEGKAPLTLKHFLLLNV